MRRILGGTIDGVDQTLTERYAATPPWRRRTTIAGVVALAVVALAWLAWAAFAQASPKVESQLVTFHVDDAHTVSSRVDVTVSSGATGTSCTVQALAADHSVVGELTFVPRAGSNDVTVRTEREATAVDVPGCIADGQDHPR
jgi:hypothetical protein